MNKVIDFSKVDLPTNLLDKILLKHSEIEIFRWYFEEDFQLNRKYKSPFRKDERPSFGFYYSHLRGKVLANDFKTGEKLDCFAFVAKLFNISRGAAIEKVAADFGIIKGRVDATRITVEQANKLANFSKNLTTYEFEYQTIRKNYNDRELEWWKKFNITLDILKKFNVYSISSVYVNKNRQKFEGMKFAYFFPSTNKVKIYCPEEIKDRKWRGNVSAVHDIYGYEQLPDTGDLLFITKSLKDVMSLYSFGYHAIAFQSETYNGNQGVINGLKARFKRIIVMFDNDATGVDKANYFKEQYDLEVTFIPLYLETKDISDTIASYGVEFSKGLMSILTMGIEEREKIIALHSYFNELLDHMGIKPNDIGDVKYVGDTIYIYSKKGKCRAVTEMVCDNSSSPRGAEWE